MNTQSDFIVVQQGIACGEGAINARVLKERKLYKAHSLCVAHISGIRTPPTIVLLDDIPALAEKFLASWGFPVMMRMDYASIKEGDRPLGGVSVRTMTTLVKISSWLFARGFYPILHPDYDRQKNILNANISMTPSNREILIEVVGQYFDATDLRRGIITPHEILKIDPVEGNILDRKIVSEDNYQKAREIRAAQINKHNQYNDIANKEDRMRTSLEDILPEKEKIAEIFLHIPDRYQPISRDQIKHLTSIALALQMKVVQKLPPSSSAVVASMSLMPDLGWVLWDVYGPWYQR